MELDTRFIIRNPTLAEITKLPWLGLPKISHDSLIVLYW